MSHGLDTKMNCEHSSIPYSHCCVHKLYPHEHRAINTTLSFQTTALYQPIEVKFWGIILKLSWIKTVRLALTTTKKSSVCYFCIVGKISSGAQHKSRPEIQLKHFKNPSLKLLACTIMDKLLYYSLQFFILDVLYMI